VADWRRPVNSSSIKPRDLRAHWELGRLPPEKLPNVALQLLEAGFDGQSIRELAGFVRPSRGEVDALADAAFEEAGAEQLGPAAAAWVVAREIASAIVTGEISPHQGAQDIANLATTSPELRSLNVFAGLASEWEDDLGHRTQYEAAIREEALTIAELE
jgi:hypothetical protein